MSSHPRTVVYHGITKARKDKRGNLRLYRHGFLGLTCQVVFHPAGEWLHHFLTNGRCTVTLAGPKRKWKA